MTDTTITYACAEKETLTACPDLACVIDTCNTPILKEETPNTSRRLRLLGDDNGGDKTTTVIYPNCLLKRKQPEYNELLKPFEGTELKPEYTCEAADLMTDLFFSGEKNPKSLNGWFGPIYTIDPAKTVLNDIRDVASKTVAWAGLDMYGYTAIDQPACEAIDMVQSLNALRYKINNKIPHDDAKTGHSTPVQFDGAAGDPKSFGTGAEDAYWGSLTGAVTHDGFHVVDGTFDGYLNQLYYSDIDKFMKAEDLDTLVSLTYPADWKTATYGYVGTGIGGYYLGGNFARQFCLSLGCGVNEESLKAVNIYSIARGLNAGNNTDQVFADGADVESANFNFGFPIHNALYGHKTLWGSDPNDEGKMANVLLGTDTDPVVTSTVKFCGAQMTKNASSLIKISAAALAIGFAFLA